ncbi:MAG: hypothetical protein CM1200mP2_05750 [Planctomycetaceae bacterium]|nr:MAG: hypothetical protein CM1200mP2_05750 [Planctomycetaceae bacterium]
MGAILVSIHWAVGGLFLVTESDFLSRRIRSGLPRRKLVRLLASPFLPGSGRGLVLVYGHLLVFVLATVAMSLWRGIPGSADLVQMGIGGVANVVLWMGIAAAIGRWGRRRSHRFTPVAMRVFTVVLFIVVQIASFFRGLRKSAGSLGFLSRFCCQMPPPLGKRPGIFSDRRRAGGRGQPVGDVPGHDADRPGSRPRPVAAEIVIFAAVQEVVSSAE